MRHAEILDGDTQRGGLADDAVTRRLDDAEAAVGFLALGRDQHVQRRAAGRRVRNVVHLAVGDGDRAGQPRARDIRQRSVDGAEQAGAGIAAFRHGDGAQLQVGKFRRLLRDRGPRRLGQSRAIADLHRGGLVDHQQADVGQVFAGLLHQPRTGQPEQQHREAGEPPDRAACPARGGECHHQQRQHAECGDQPERQQRIEAQGGDGFRGAHRDAYCPSRCNIAGTCTWSPL